MLRRGATPPPIESRHGRPQAFVRPASKTQLARPLKSRMQFPPSPHPQQAKNGRISTIQVHDLKYREGNCMRNWSPDDERRPQPLRTHHTHTMRAFSSSSAKNSPNTAPPETLKPASPLRQKSAPKRPFLACKGDGGFISLLGSASKGDGGFKPPGHLADRARSRRPWTLSRARGPDSLHLGPTTRTLTR